jgi:hypothetical protein
VKELTRSLLSLKKVECGPVSVRGPWRCGHGVCCAVHVSTSLRSEMCRGILRIWPQSGKRCAPYVCVMYIGTLTVLFP